MFRNKRVFTVVSTSIPQPSSNIWVCPGGVNRIRLVGYGGGAGGGGGGGSNGGGVLISTTYACGGGGGGGATQGEIDVNVTPGTSYEFVIGAGGAGGAGGASGNNTGGDGAVGGTSLMRVLSGSTLASFYGGVYGYGGATLVSTNGPLFYYIAPGGDPVQGRLLRRLLISISDQTYGLTNSRLPWYPNVPGSGGPGMTTHGDNSTAVANTSPYSLRNGAPSIQGFLGGAGGIMGYDNGSGYVHSNKGFSNYQAGGPGGGGGGGPGGPGGHGGSVYDDYMAYGGYTSSFAPEGAADNSGGGGGGGSGATGLISTYVGINGSPGGSGKLSIYW